MVNAVSEALAVRLAGMRRMMDRAIRFDRLMEVDRVVAEMAPEMVATGLRARLNRYRVRMVERAASIMSWHTHYQPDPERVAALAALRDRLRAEIAG